MSSKKDSGSDGGFSLKRWAHSVWAFAREDTSRVTFSLKVGLAVLLASLLILIRAPYEIFGTNIAWSILTVSIMFEYTVGATLNRGINGAVGSILAGILVVAVMQVAMSSGHVAEPYVIGFSIFLIGAVTSFMKLSPTLVQYEDGFRVTLFNYCLILMSGHRMGTPSRIAMDSLYLIAVGGLIAVLVNVLICPIWTGEQLHQELEESFNSIADSLEGCVKKYLKDDGSNKPEFPKMVMEDFPDEPAYKKCRDTLNSAAKLEILEISAKWEPPHGRFRHFFYPWSEYVKVGAVLRHCAYEVMALHGCLHSEIQAPYSLRMAFQVEILDATVQAAELLRSLGSDVRNMKQTLQTTLLKRVHTATERLQRSIDMHSYLLTAAHDLAAADTPAKPPNQLSATLSFSPHASSEPGAGGLEPGVPPPKAVLSLAEHRRLYSWPSREVDEFEEGGGDVVIRRMRALESTAALSLATFASLLIEFVARLDRLVDAVDELAKMAGFQQEDFPRVA